VRPSLTHLGSHSRWWLEFTRVSQCRRCKWFDCQPLVQPPPLGFSRDCLYKYVRNSMQYNHLTLGGTHFFNISKAPCQHPITISPPLDLHSRRPHHLLLRPDPPSVFDSATPPCRTAAAPKFSITTPQLHNYFVQCSPTTRGSDGIVPTHRRLTAVAPEPPSMVGEMMRHQQPRKS
jgi:hypothetical protein